MRGEGARIPSPSFRFSRPPEGGTALDAEARASSSILEKILSPRTRNDYFSCMNDSSTPIKSELKERLASIPALPGVYQMKNSSGTILYVGKAKNLKARVGSYFRSDVQGRGPRIKLLVSRIRDIETIVTDSEKEALLLEDMLIKKHKPRFNVDLRDDKHYLYLKFNMQEQFPRLTLVRKVKKDQGLYFGPYTSAKGVRETWRLLHRYFPLRRCRPDRDLRRPCLYFQMGSCSCGELTDPAEYRYVVKDVKRFLEGRDRSLIDDLKLRMAKASENLEFERAARFRDQIHYLDGVLEKQKIISMDFADRDVVGWSREDSGPVALVVLFIRSGRLTGTQGFLLRRTGLTDSETLSSFLMQFYGEEKLIPKQVLAPFPLEDAEALEQVLGERRGGKFSILVPVRGEKRKLLLMAEANAEKFREERKKRTRTSEEILLEARQRLHLRRAPKIMECFDISNLQGREAVGSKVVFRDGKPEKDAYRRYKIRSVEGADDYAMMYEVLKRRFQRGIEEEYLPDLLVVDGGKGQLNVALKVLHELGLEDVDAVGMAKIHAGRGEEQSHERFFLPNRKNPVILPDYSEILTLFQRLRDEAHRFAVTFHRKVKKKKDFRSVLEDIPGVGARTAARLLTHFGSLDGVWTASEEELARATDRRVARAVTKAAMEKREGEARPSAESGDKA